MGLKTCISNQLPDAANIVMLDHTERSEVQTHFWGWGGRRKGKTVKSLSCSVTLSKPPQCPEPRCPNAEKRGHHAGITGLH